MANVKALYCAPSTLVGLNIRGELDGWRSEEQERACLVLRGERAISSTGHGPFTRGLHCEDDHFPHGYLLVHSTHSLLESLPRDP